MKIVDSMIPNYNTWFDIILSPKLLTTIRVSFCRGNKKLTTQQIPPYYIKIYK